MSRRLLALAIALAGVVSAGAAHPASSAPPLMLDSGHIDIGPFFDASDQLAMGVHTTGGWIPTRDVVLVIAAGARKTVPANGTGGIQWDHVGPRNSEVWVLPDVNPNGLLWAGFDAEDLTKVQRDFPTVLEGVRGPAGSDVVLSLSNAPLPFFSTRSGLPAVHRIRGHAHMNWFFTRSGVYCLHLRSEGRRASDGSRVTASGQLTFVTADVHHDGILPCEQQAEPAPVATSPSIPDAPSGGAPKVLRSGTFDLAPRLDGDALAVDLVQRSGRDAGRIRRPRDVVFYHRPPLPQAPGHNVPWQQAGGATEVWQLGRPGSEPRLRWNTIGVGQHQLDGDLEWRLHGVQGPLGGGPAGHFSADDAITRREGRPALSTVPGWEHHDTYDPWPESLGETEWTFSRPGVYCVDLGWTARLPGGSERSERMVLTLAVDEPEGRPSLVDPATVVPCERRNDPEEIVVLDQGHVDLATRLLDDDLEVALRDDTGGPANMRFRDLAGVLLHAPPTAATTVPEDPAYRFLGPAGAPLFVLPQTQDESLLWPGWSTETLGADRVPGPVTWRVDGIRGPGHVALWTTSVFDGPQVLFNSRDGLPDAFEVPLGTHSHGSWGFERAGTYCIDLTVSAPRLGSATPRSVPATIAVHAGALPSPTPTPGTCPAHVRPTPDLPAGPSDPAPSEPGPPLPPAGPTGLPDPVATATSPGTLRLSTSTRALRTTVARLRRGVLVAVTLSERKTTIRSTLLVPRTLARRLGLRPQGTVARVPTGRRRLAGRTGRVGVQVPRSLARRLARVPTRQLRGLRLEIAATSTSGVRATSTRPLVVRASR